MAPTQLQPPENKSSEPGHQKQLLLLQRQQEKTNALLGILVEDDAKRGLWAIVIFDFRQLQMVAVWDVLRPIYHSALRVGACSSGIKCGIWVTCVYPM